MNQQNLRKKISKAKHKNPVATPKPPKTTKPESHLDANNALTPELMRLEKQILLRPNESLHWIQLVAFKAEHCSLQEAEAQIERGLSAVNFRNDKERLNLWKCFINLEYFFGSKEKLYEVGRKAMNACDRHKILSHLIALFAGDKKFEEAESLVVLLLKKQENKFAAWLSYVQLFLSWANHLLVSAKTEDKEKIERQFGEKIKEIMKRALQSLDRREHVSFLTQYAILEYKHRNFLSARTVFENLVSSFPKKSNIWFFYQERFY